MATFGAVALVFVFMLLDRNSQIREQMELALENAHQAKSNESYALALLSEQHLEDGDRSAALQSTLEALPVGIDDRLYRVEAEMALADALYVYQTEGLRQVSRMEQITDVEDMVLSADGTRLIMRDVNNILRCFDTLSGALLWKQDKSPSQPKIVAVLDEEDTVIVAGYNGIKRFRLDNGGLLAEYELHNDYYDVMQNTLEVNSVARPNRNRRIAHAR